MRLLLGVSLILLFLWLQTSVRSSDGKNVCEAVSVSKAAVSLLLSPLSLYSWMASTLLRFVVSVPALVLGALHHSLLLVLAVPWCLASISISFLLTCLHVALYLLHMVLVVGVVAILSLTLHKTSDGDSVKEGKTKAPFQQMRVGGHPTKIRPRMSGRGLA